MSTLNAFIISSLAGMSTLIGGIIIFLNIKEKNIKRFITFCLAFSIAIMIGISVTDLIPSSLFDILASFTRLKAIVVVLFTFGIGVLAVLIINKLMQKYDDSLYKLGIMSMLALMLHNFPEGIATFIGGIHDTSLGLKLAIAIAFHNIPEGIAIAVPIYYATKSKTKALKATLLSGLAEPLGALLAFLFLKNYITNLLISFTLLFVAGIMITLAIEEMFPKAFQYQENKYLTIGLLSGIFIIILNHFLF